MSRRRRVVDPEAIVDARLLKGRVLRQSPWLLLPELDSRPKCKSKWRPTTTLPDMPVAPPAKVLPPRQHDQLIYPFGRVSWKGSDGYYGIVAPIVMRPFKSTIAFPLVVLRDGSSHRTAWPVEAVELLTVDQATALGWQPKRQRFFDWFEQRLL